MPGERWPDKRARAVLFAGANKLAKDGSALDADSVADAGIAVRDHLFVDPEVREENADVKAHRIGYSADCMQFATLEPTTHGATLGLWLGAAGAAEAREALGAEDDPNPFRKLYGWVRVHTMAPRDAERLSPWIERARKHAADTKRAQDATAATKRAA